MISRGKLSLGRLAVMIVAVAMFAVPSSAFAQANGGDQVLTQTQTGAAGGAASDALGAASGGDNNQIQQGAQQNCTIGGNGECNQSIEQNASINAGGGGVAARRVQFVRNVPLARTGFDAWMLALLGGVSLAGGLGLLAAQRRGSSSR